MSTEPVASSSFELCPACGYRAESGERRCGKCGRRLTPAPEIASAKLPGGVRESRLHVVNPHTANTSKPSQIGSTTAPSPRAPRTPAFPEPLRRQLSAQVQEFRARRRPSLPFPIEDASQESEQLKAASEAVPAAERKPEGKTEAKPETKTASRAAEPQPRHPRKPTQPQSPLAFPEPYGAPLHLEFSAPPVASFRTRLLADSFDFALILVGVALCLVPLPLLGGQVVWNRYVAAGGFAIVCLVALLYGLIFVYLAGATPAMRRMGLRLVNFDGQPASRPERLWRLLGTVASAGSFLLGFVWAAMDDERFSWHDRISRTFLTSDHLASSVHSTAPRLSNPRNR